MTSPTTQSETPPTAANPGAGIDYRRFLDCVHCGMCTAACPTYLITGDENDGPRGRIYLMRGVTDGRINVGPEVTRHLELCLDCRACETACPAGVRYGQLIEPFRAAMKQNAIGATHDWFHRWILFGLFPFPKRMRAALAPARVAQRLRLDRFAQAIGLTRLLPARLRQMADMLPPLVDESPELPEFLPAIGPRRARVALFTGCIGDALFRATHWATARVLQQNGCDVLIPRQQVCCGAIHLHAGAPQPAQAFALANLKAFDDLRGVDALVANVAGCGAMLKDYGHHWHGADQPRLAAFAAKVRDVSEFLDSLGLIAPTHPVHMTATYHDACHLAHAQGIREAPRRLLAKIPGLRLKELPESDLCCGAAGTYNLTEPEMSGQLARRKLNNILSTGAEVVITGNAGCWLQIAAEARRQGKRLEVVHPLELLDRSYAGSEQWPGTLP